MYHQSHDRESIWTKNNEKLIHDVISRNRFFYPIAIRLSIRKEQEQKNQESRLQKEKTRNIEALTRVFREDFHFLGMAGWVI